MTALRLAHVLTALCTLCLAAAALAQTAAPEIKPDAARRDLHPGLYRYTTPAALDAEFAAGVMAGAELLSIDDRQLAEISAALLPYLRADGLHQGALAERDRQLPPPSEDWQLRNEGGVDAIGQRLMAHLLRQPFTLPRFRVESAYERAPYDLVRSLDTWDYGFFDRTGKVTREAGSRNWRLADQPGRRIEPVAQPYTGRVVLLVGPQNSSAGFLLARDLKASGGAVLVGQPTGGNLRGLNGGQLAWVTLPASGVGVGIPLIAAFDTSNPPDAGVLPDLAVAPNWADAVAGVDSEMVAAQALVAGWRRGAR